VLFFIFLALCARFLSGGSVSRAVLCLMVALAPPAVYLLVKRPLIFPFACYVCLVPLNAILFFGHLGTLSKLLGAMSFIALALWLVRHRLVVKPHATTFVWLALTLWIILGGLWAIDRYDWLGDLTPGGGVGLLTFLELLGLYIVVAAIPVRSIDWNVTCIAVVTGGLIAAAVSFYQLFVTGGFLSGRLWVTGVGGQVADPNHFAGALLLAIFVTTAAALHQKAAMAKLALMLCLCALMCGIFLSGSRDAMIAVAIGFFYMMWRGRYRAQLAVYALVAGLAAAPMLPALAARFVLATSDFGAGRLFIWRVGWDALKTYWLLGAGFNNFPNAFDRSYLHVYMSQATGYQRAGHNLLLTSAVELGLLGAGLMLLAWVLQFRMLKSIDRTSPFYDWRVALEAALLALFVSCMFLDNMFEKYTWLTFCVVALFRSRYVTSLNDNVELAMPREPGCRLPDSDVYRDSAAPWPLTTSSLDR